MIVEIYSFRFRVIAYATLSAKTLKGEYGAFVNKKKAAIEIAASLTGYKA
jgi:hypothetical protein